MQKGEGGCLDPLDPMIVVGSLASSDLFYDAYHHKLLSREALCPCAGSPETLTVSVRRYVCCLEPWPAPSPRLPLALPLPLPLALA